MGADQSKTLPVDEWSCDDVVASIQALGDQYAGYGPLIHEKQVTGHVLANIGKDTMDVELEQLGVQSRLHRRVLVKKLLVLRGEATTGAAAAADQKQRASRSLSPKRSSNRTSRSGRKPSGTNTSDDDNNNNGNPPMRRASTCNPPSSKSKTREPDEADKAKFWAMLEEAAEKQRRDHEALMAREATLKAQLGSFIGGVTRRLSGFFYGIAAVVAPEDLGDVDDNDDDDDNDDNDNDNNNSNQNEVKQNSKE